MGANDGLVSTVSLVIAVAASGAGRSAVLVAGMAGLVTFWGAWAMAVTTAIGRLFGAVV